MKKLLFTLVLVITTIHFTSAQETQQTEQKKWKFGLHFDNLSSQQKGFNAETNGVVINKVSKNHPAEKAGVQVGDILTHIDTTEVKNKEHCIKLMKEYDTSKGSAMLKIIRNGVKMDIKVNFK